MQSATCALAQSSNQNTGETLFVPWKSSHLPYGKASPKVTGKMKRGFCPRNVSDSLCPWHQVPGLRNRTMTLLCLPSQSCYLPATGANSGHRLFPNHSVFSLTPFAYAAHPTQNLPHPHHFELNPPYPFKPESNVLPPQCFLTYQLLLSLNFYGVCYFMAFITQFPNILL